MVHITSHHSDFDKLQKKLAHSWRYTRAQMDVLENQLDRAGIFSRDSTRFFQKCTKPDRKEYQRIVIATSIGVAIMGFLGFFVKLIHYPIKQILFS
ncbi:unnamed protein product, partial [Mesorhabditis spiculigera]